MFKNYLKIAWRNLIKSKGYTAINITGLAVGVCCFLLISLFVKSEFSYDRFHSKADRIYRVWQHENYGPKEDFVNTTTPVSMMQVLKSNYPEIEDGSRVYRFNALVKRNENEFNESIRAVDPSFFKIFDFSLLSGDQSAPFADVNSILLSESSAKKYFGQENPIGKSLELKFDEKIANYEVTGIISDPPKESSIQYDMLVSLENESDFFSERARRSWFNVVLETYLLLRPDQSPEKLVAKFPEAIKQYLGDNFQENTFFLNLQPISEIHLDTSLPPGFEPISNPKYSYVLATIGFLILILACINFVTLAVGRSFSRATEVGVRKALGAFRKQILYQFWGEALLITILAVLAGIFLSLLFLDTFNNLTGKLHSLQLDGTIWLMALGLIIFIASIAGVYPSLILSKFNPIEVLVRKKVKGASMGIFGKGLVVVQFTVSIVMIMGTLIIGRQINFLTNKDLGYQKDAIVVVPTNKSGEEAESLAKLYIEALKKQPQISEASSSAFSFVENSWYEVGFTDSKDTYREFALNIVDPGFLSTYNIPLVAGRDFQEGNVADTQNGVLVNETFVKKMGLKNPLEIPYEKFGVKIVGVLKDFNFQSLNYPIEPLMLAINPEPIFKNVENVNAVYEDQPRVSVRLNDQDMTSNIALLQTIWEKINPSQAFEYKFLDASLAAQYQNEQRSKTIVNIASLLSLFIACMGLFGLTTLTVARRTAEIGIRKVLGASELNIAGLIASDFLKLVALAFLIAFPIAWWGMRQWLQGFAYSIQISWWVYLLTGILVVLITLLVISIQSIKASMANPVDSLRNE